MVGVGLGQTGGHVAGGIGGEGFAGRVAVAVGVFGIHVEGVCRFGCQPGEVDRCLVGAKPIRHGAARGAILIMVCLYVLGGSRPTDGGQPCVEVAHFEAARLGGGGDDAKLYVVVVLLKRLVTIKRIDIVQIRGEVIVKVVNRRIISGFCITEYIHFARVSPNWVVHTDDKVASLIIERRGKIDFHPSCSI